MTAPDDHAASETESLRQAAHAGYRASAGSALWVTLVQALQLIVPPLLLEDPSELGLFALLQVVSGFGATFADLGVSGAILRQGTLTSEQQSKLYLLNLAASTGVAILIAVSGVPLANAFHAESLARLAPWAGVTVLVTAVGNPFRLLLQKDLHFQLLARAEMVSATLAFLAVIAGTAAGLGAVALLWGPLLQAMVRTWFYVREGWPRWPVRWTRKPVDLSDHLRFGAYQVGERLVNLAVSRIDQLITGYYFDTRAIGYYALAQQYTTAPLSRINPSMNLVSLPVLARQLDQPDAARKTYLESMEAVLHVNAPLMIGMAAVAAPLIAVFAGSVWANTANLLVLSAWAQLIRSHANPVGNLLLASGNARLGFWWNLGLALVQTPLTLWAASMGNVEYVAAMVLAVQVLITPINYVCLVRPYIGGSAREYFLAIARPVCPAVIMGGAVFTLDQTLLSAWSPAERLAAAVTFGVACHATILRFTLPQVFRTAWQLLGGSAAAESAPKKSGPTRT